MRVRENKNGDEDEAAPCADKGANGTNQKSCQ